MYTINRERIITMNRGDSLRVPLLINAGDKWHIVRYILSYDDEVCLSICEPDQEFEHGVLRQVYTKKDLNKQGDVMINISSDETEDLVPGLYYLEIKVKLTNGRVGTIFPRRKFYIYE